MKIDLEELEKEKKRNAEERLQFIKFWAQYIKTHSDEEWSKQQNVLIDSQFEGIEHLKKRKIKNPKK